MKNDLISLKTILEHEDVYLHNAEEEIKMLNEYLKKQKQRRRKAFRRKCFFALNYIMATVFILSVCCLNGDGWTAELLCIISVIYGLFANYLWTLYQEQRGEC